MKGALSSPGTSPVDPPATTTGIVVKIVREPVRLRFRTLCCSPT
jgi:hypothetical protein